MFDEMIAWGMLKWQTWSMTNSDQRSTMERTQHDSTKHGGFTVPFFYAGNCFKVGEGRKKDVNRLQILRLAFVMKATEKKRWRRRRNEVGTSFGRQRQTPVVPLSPPFKYRPLSAQRDRRDKERSFEPSGKSLPFAEAHTKKFARNYPEGRSWLRITSRTVWRRQNVFT